MRGGKLSLWILLAGLTACFLIPLASNAQTTPNDLISEGIVLNTTTAATISPLAIQNATRSQYGTYEKILIKEASEETTVTSKGAEQVFAYRIEFRTGALKGKTQRVLIQPSSLPAGLKPQVGDLIIAFVQPDANQQDSIIFFENYDRQNTYFWLVLSLILAGLIFAGLKSLKSPLIYLLIFLIFFKVAIPLHSWQWPSWSIALISLACVSGSLGLIFARGKSAVLLVIAGTFTSGLLAYGLFTVIIPLTHLTFPDIFSNSLNPEILMTLGTWLIAVVFLHEITLATVYGSAEIKRIAGTLSFKEFFKTSMTIGREKLTNLSPLLLIVFFGLPILQLAQVTAGNYPWLKFINSENVAQVLILPLTSLLSLTFSLPLISLVISLANTNRANRSNDPLRRAISWRQEELTTTIETVETTTE